MTRFSFFKILQKKNQKRMTKPVFFPSPIRARPALPKQAGRRRAHLGDQEVHDRADGQRRLGGVGRPAAGQGQPAAQLAEGERRGGRRLGGGRQRRQARSQAQADAAVHRRPGHAAPAGAQHRESMFIFIFCSSNG